MTGPLFHIILVEDAEPDVLLVREALEQSGLEFDLRVFDDGEQGVAFVDTMDQDTTLVRPHLFLLDLNLTGRIARAAGPPGKRIILFDYIPSRTKEGLKQLLIDPDGTAYRGKLLTDGLERYDEICAELNLLHFGCMQHARAHFFKARKVSQLPSSRTLANAAIEDHIRQIFAVESQIEKLRSEHEQRGQSLPLERIYELRQDKSKPVLEKFKAWVDELLPARPLTVL